jgi:hypothetical protein
MPTKIKMLIILAILNDARKQRRDASLVSPPEAER